MGAHVADYRLSKDMRLARQDENNVHISAPNLLQSNLRSWCVDKCRALGAARAKLCRRSYTTVPIDEGPEVAYSQLHLQEQVLEHTATPAWGTTS